MIADGFRNTTLLTDNATHIVLCDVQVVDDGTVLGGLIYIHSYRIGSLDESLCNRDK